MHSESCWEPETGARAGRAGRGEAGPSGHILRHQWKQMEQQNELELHIACREVVQGKKTYVCSSVNMCMYVMYWCVCESRWVS